jgi:hypothetical protein
LSAVLGASETHCVLAGGATIKVLGSIPRWFQVRATTTAGCSPRGSAITGDTNDETIRAAESELRTLAFMAVLLEGVFV